MTTRYRCQNETCNEIFYFPAKETTTITNLSDQTETIEQTICPHCKQTNFTEEDAPEIISLVRCSPHEADDYIAKGYRVLPEKIFENTVVLVKYNDAVPEPEDQTGAECSTDSNKQNNKNNKNQNPNQTSNSPAVNQFELWSGRLTPMEVETTT
jgi:hypothetical protein